jgi:hypothetical protein
MKVGFASGFIDKNKPAALQTKILSSFFIQKVADREINGRKYLKYLNYQDNIKCWHLHNYPPNTIFKPY